MTMPVSYFYPWVPFTERTLPELFADFAARGLRDLAVGGPLSERLLEEPELAGFLRREAGRCGLAFHDSHAPHRPGWELNAGDDDLLARHLRLLDRYAELGCRTVTVHAGTNDHAAPLDLLRARTCRSLEALVTRARALGLVVALENTVFPTDTPEELLGYRRRFRDGAFGFCFDVGHANLMDAAPDKRSADMVDWIRRRWNEAVRFEADTLGPLLPDIVTVHLHDNDGRDDQHKPPGAGTIDWPRVFGRLADAPRLLSLQNETDHRRHGVSAAAVAECIRKLMERSVPLPERPTHSPRKVIR